MDMTEDQWKLFVPLYNEFKQTIEKATSVLFKEDFCYHIPEIFDGEEYYGSAEPYVEFTTEEYDRCDGTSYYTRTISAKTFIENNLDQEQERLNKEKEEARLKKAEEERVANEKREAEMKANRLRQYLALKKEFLDM